jgi:hypothetical protein
MLSLSSWHKQINLNVRLMHYTFEDSRSVLLDHHGHVRRLRIAGQLLEFVIGAFLNHATTIQSFES